MVTTVNTIPNPGPFPNTQLYSTTFTGTSAAGNIVIATSGLLSYSLQAGGGTGTVSLWGSNDGTNFGKLGSDVALTGTAVMTFYANSPCAFLQIRCTAYTSGTITTVLLS